MTSYEALADAAFTAAVNIEHHLEDQSRPLDKLEIFSKMLAEPLNNNSQYKLLYDARILPLYRSAWSELKGQANQKKNGNTILAEISDFINNAKMEIEKSKSKGHAKQVAKFCLLMNRVFLEENACAYESSFRSRGANAAIGMDRL